MTYSLIFILFLALFGMLYLIIHLFQRVKQLESQDISSAKQEIEESLTAYITDIKEENEAFLKALDAKETEPVEKKVSPPKDRIIKNTEEPGFTPSVKAVEDAYEPTLTSQVLALNDKGFSVTEIAKKLNKGKGEISLLLKFKKNT